MSSNICQCHRSCINFVVMICGVFPLLSVYGCWFMGGMNLVVVAKGTKDIMLYVLTVEEVPVNLVGVICIGLGSTDHKNGGGQKLCNIDLMPDGVLTTLLQLHNATFYDFVLPSLLACSIVLVVSATTKQLVFQSLIPSRWGYQLMIYKKKQSEREHPMD